LQIFGLYPLFFIFHLSSTGALAQVVFILSLFTDKVSLYEVHNTGGWYDFGFVLGAGILFGGGSQAAKGKRC
jgi:hypothetical protein